MTMPTSPVLSSTSVPTGYTPRHCTNCSTSQAGTGARARDTAPAAPPSATAPAERPHAGHRVEAVDDAGDAPGATDLAGSARRPGSRRRVETLVVGAQHGAHVLVAETRPSYSQSFLDMPAHALHVLGAERPLALQQFPPARGSCRCRAACRRWRGRAGPFPETEVAAEGRVNAQQLMAWP